MDYKNVSPYIKEFQKRSTKQDVDTWRREGNIGLPSRSRINFDNSQSNFCSSSNGSNSCSGCAGGFFSGSMGGSIGR